MNVLISNDFSDFQRWFGANNASDLNKQKRKRLELHSSFKIFVLNVVEQKSKL